MYDIYYTLKNIPLLTGIAIFVAILLSIESLLPIFSLFSKNRKKEVNQSTYRLVNDIGIKKSFIIIACLVCTFTLVFSYNLTVWLLDGKTDLRMAPEGRYSYYVLAEREDSSKQYTLPAKVEKHEGDYFVQKVYFSNGGYLYFDDGDYIEYDETFYSTDQDGEFWEIDLTNRKAYNPSVIEHYEISFWRLFFIIVPSILMVTYALLLLFTKNKKYSEENTNLRIEKYKLISEKEKTQKDLNDIKEHSIFTEQQTQELIGLAVTKIKNIDERLAEIDKEIIE